MAELVDALVLGTSANGVGVRVPSSAPKTYLFELTDRYEINQKWLIFFRQLHFMRCCCCKSSLNFLAFSLALIYACSIKKLVITAVNIATTLIEYIDKIIDNILPVRDTYIIIFYILKFVMSILINYRILHSILVFIFALKSTAS